ncbi:MAG TPA: dihydroneopterin aldolase [Caulobacteraceae bacterium]
MVRDLSVTADIGVHAHEVGRPQSLIVNVTLRVRPPASDQLAETIDYTDVVSAAQSLANQRIGLIESFAHRLATACLRHPAVEEADVLIEKPGALADGLAGARVVLERTAAEADWERSRGGATVAGGGGVPRGVTVRG